MKQLGYSKGYRYAHGEPEAYAAGENYFPEAMGRRQYYRPTPRGLEAKIAERLAHWRELDRQYEQRLDRQAKPKKSGDDDK
jgi:putative ATPase